MTATRPPKAATGHQRGKNPVPTLRGMTRPPQDGNGNGSTALHPEVTDAIIEAVFAELAEKGFLGMSMEGVARRAGVGKSALYRRWPSKVEMAVSVVALLSVTDEPARDTGTVEGDVRALLEEIGDWMGGPTVQRIYPDLIAEAQRNPMLAEAMRDHVGRPRRLRVQTLLDRAAARGELAGSANQSLIIDAFGSMIFWRLITLGRPLTPDYLDEVTSLILHLIRGNPRTAPN